MRFTPRILRLLRLASVPDTDEIMSPATTPCLEPDQVRTIQVALLGAAWAARAEIRRNSGFEPLRFVEKDVASDSFERARRESRVRVQKLMQVFLPTVFLYTDERPAPGTCLLALDDPAPPHDLMKALTFTNAKTRGTSRSTHSSAAHGDAYLVPPAIHGEGRKRSQWLLASKLEPPSVKELGGAWWRLGETELWRMWVLSWQEKLILAALLGTRFETCVVLASPRHFPRVGFVVETARLLRRTCICVPIESCPQSLLESLMDCRIRPGQASSQSLLSVF